MIVFYPAVRDPEDLAEISARASWYFGGAMRTGEAVVIPVFGDLAASPPPFFLQHNPAWPAPERRETPAERLVLDADKVLAWDSGALAAAPAAIRRKAKRGDELCDVGAAEAWMRLAPPVDDAPVVHRANFAAYAKAQRERRLPALILGAGPSLSRAAEDADLPPVSINVYGGSSIFNEEAVRSRPPNIIAIPDIAGQCGPSMTAARYRERLFGVLYAAPGARVAVPEIAWRCLEAVWPTALKERVFAMPETRLRPVGADLSACYSYQPTSNVLTSFLLPIAAALSDEIHFVGIDGAGGDKQAATGWGHSREEEYVAETLESALAHGRVQVSDLGAYYDAHWRRAARDCDAFAASGKTLHLPSPIVACPPARFLALRDRQHEALSRIYAFVEALETRPGLASIASAAFVFAVGSLMTPGLVSVLFFAVFAGALTIVYFSLRARMSRALARHDRDRAASEARALKALAARLDRLERHVRVDVDKEVSDDQCAGE